ncbi:hypothetical protein AB0M48_20285 [Lentzea sp. NPDC051208]|uniref:hypothetical protein n=1 Tax=Lentzea sp. NPDC051208 TaxID=3154642 RepID=UPI00343A5FB6
MSEYEERVDVLAFRGSVETTARLSYVADRTGADCQVSVDGPWGVVEATGHPDVFEALKEVRLELERDGWFLAIEGARRDVMCWGVNRGMTTGTTVQALGGNPNKWMSVFSAAPRSLVGTVAEQEDAERAFTDNKPTAVGMHAVVPAEVAEHDTVVWHDELYAAEHVRVPHRQADHVRFGEHEALPATLAESWFRQVPVARAGHRAYQVHGSGEDGLVVSRWNRQPLSHDHRLRLGAAAAKRETLQLADFDELCQVRLEFLPQPDAILAGTRQVEIGAGSPPKPPRVQKLVDEVGRLVSEHAPVPWRTIRVRCQATANWQELTTSSVDEGGAITYWPAPERVSQLFRRIRAVCHDYSYGTWFSAEVTMAEGERPGFDHDNRQEPDWRPYFEDWFSFGLQGVRHELLHFATAPERTPDWLAAATARVAFSARMRPPATDTLIARTFDGMDEETGTPKYFRAPVVAEEKAKLLAYLTSAPVVWASSGSAPDLLAPERPYRVPVRYHTDGRWVWSASIAHYLERHDVSPDQSLLGHIRDRNHELPRSLPSPVLSRAKAVATDDPEEEPGVAEALAQALQAVNAAIGEHDLNLVRTGDRFEVSGPDGEHRAEFDTPGDAAAYLIGLVRSRA